MRAAADEECEISLIITEGVSCPRLTGARSARQDRVRVWIPRSCLGNPRWVRAAADTFGWDDDVWSSDRWAPDGSDESSWVGPFGDKVRKG